MADHNEVISRVRKREGVSYPVLVPNMAGLNNAVLYCLLFLSFSIIYKGSQLMKRERPRMSRAMRLAKE